MKLEYLMRTAWRLCIFFILFQTSVTAQITVNGTVIDAATGQPLPGATVAIEGVAFQVQADEKGRFSIFIPEQGKAFKVTAGSRTQRFYLVKDDSLVLPMPPNRFRGLVHPYSQKTVDGVVLDTAGLPIVQAFVEIEGTSFRVNTDNEGKFRIYIPPKAKGFLVKHGKLKHQFPLGPGTFFTLKMGEKLKTAAPETAIDWEFLRLTTATVIQRENDFNQGRIADPMELVQGSVTGLGISRPGSNPNAAFDLRIRGLTTFTQRAAPLIVVDGLPESPLQALDPMNIVKITVLKDAASAARFGIRGNAGIIEIETKQGGEKNLGVDYQAFGGIESIDYYWPVASAEDFTALGGSDFGSSTDWQKEITQTAVQHAHHLSLHGKKGNTGYRLGLGYRDIEGTVKGSGYDNLQASLFLSQTALKSRLQLTGRLGANRRLSDLTIPTTVHYSIVSNPTAPVYGDDPQSQEYGGYFYFPFFGYNPVALLEQNKWQDRNWVYTGHLKAKMDLWKGFYVAGHFAGQKTDRTRTFFSSENSPYIGHFYDGYAEQDRLNRTNLQGETQIGYEGIFLKTNLTWETGYAFQRIRSQEVYSQLKGIPFDQFTLNPLEEISLSNNQESDTRKTGDTHDLPAWFTRLGLNYGGFLFLDAGLRSEGSSRLGKNEKWGLFYGISAAADLGHLTEAGWLDYFKPRLGFGKTGNVPDQPFLSTRLVEESFPVHAGGVLVPGFQIIGVENPDLKWESKKEWDFGIDAGFFANRLKASIDFFRSKTEDLLQRYHLSQTSVSEDILWKNAGALKSRGWEWSLETTVVQKRGFTWQVDLRYATVNTEIENLGRETPGEILNLPNLDIYEGPVQLMEGGPVGAFYGPETANGNPEVFRDLDRNGNFCHCQDDYTTIGNGLPEQILGFTNRWMLNHLEISFSLRGVYGHDLFNVYRFRYETPFVFQDNALQTEGYSRNRTFFNEFSDYYVEKASFTRLQFATIAYTFLLPEKSPLKSLRLSLTGNNLVTFTNYQGADPEARYSYKNITPYSPNTQPGSPVPLMPGIDEFGTWLPSRVWVLGLRAGF